MPVQAVSPDSFRQDLVDQGIAIQAQTLWKTYEMGAEKLHALRGIDLVIRDGRIREAVTGALGFRQIHAG